MGAVAITYFTDPYCVWSWAAEPSWRRLLSEFAADLEITYVIAGSGGAGPDALDWLEASAASGMPVDPRGLLAEPMPVSATHPARLAVKAVTEQADPAPLLRRLREGIFLERRRLDRGDALLDLARDLTPPLDLGTLRIAFGSHGPVEALAADLDRAAGVVTPTLEIGDARIDGRAPYQTWRAAVLAAGARPAPGPLDIDTALRRFGECATAELAALCDLPGPRAPAELWRLALEWRIRSRQVLGGELWSPA